MSRPRRRLRLPERLAAIVGVVILTVLVIAVVEARLGVAGGPAPEGDDGARTTGMPPIAAEHGVFRTRPGDVAAPSGSLRRLEGHRRTLAMYRSLRAFPGAPPRIPHGLQGEEYRRTVCVACHERGGWVARFESYAPVTPHPELDDCLQCHLPDDALVGLPLPGAGPDAVCLQCHVPGVAVPRRTSLAWSPADWPERGRRAVEGAPPTIPHGLDTRGNCLACHLEPGGVEEVRTTHPERAACRQCHVQAPADEGVFRRAPGGGASATGGGP